MKGKAEQVNQQQIEESQKRLACLKEMLTMNRKCADNLKRAKKKNQKKIAQLEEFGAYSPLNLIPDFLSKLSSVCETRNMPRALLEQMKLKQPSSDFHFMKNLCEVSDKKTKLTKQQQLSIQNLGRLPRCIDFTTEYKKYNGVKNGLALYQIWRTFYRKATPSIEIPPEMEAQLVLMKEKYGRNWEKISTFFDGYTTESISNYCLKRFSETETGKWTYYQSVELLVLLEKYGYGKWAFISKKLKKKSQFQVRERYCNVLDPTIGENRWSPAEERFLMEVAEKFDYKWSRITREVPVFYSKTDNALRRKFRNLMIKKSDDVIDKEIKEKELAASIKKFKQGYYNRRRKGKKIPFEVKNEEISQSPESDNFVLEK